jgi:hypothetical protein
MATFKMTIDFEALGDQDAGWSETFWGQFNSVGAAVYGMAALATNRAAPLTASVNMTWARVTAFPAGTALASLVNLRKTPGANSQGLNGQLGTYQTVKGLLRLVNTAGTYTKQPFGGIPAACFGVNGAYNPTGPFPAGLAQFLSFLAQNSYCTKKITQAPNPYPATVGPVKWPIASISAAGVVSVPGSNFAVGQSVKLGRVPGNLGLRKTWIVATVPVAGSYTFVGFPALAAAVPVGPAAYAQQIIYAFVPIAQNVSGGSATNLQSIITRSSKHAVGRPLVAPTGRRKRRPT